MAEKLQELLEKINKDGVQQAELKAKELESEARHRADEIMEGAKAEAQRIIEQAQNTAKGTRESTETALRQAARDLILSLKEEIKKILDNIITGQVKKALTAGEISSIISALINNYVEKGGRSSDVTVLLKQADLEELKDTFTAQLQEKLKNGVEFKLSPDIKTGFAVSFDRKKSFFDFTDEAVAEALSVYLNPGLKKILP